MEKLDIERAREEVLPFVLDRGSVEIWFVGFFLLSKRLSSYEREEIEKPGN